VRSVTETFASGMAFWMYAVKASARIIENLLFESGYRSLDKERNSTCTMKPNGMA
jgi:hypothetical protein